MSQAFRLSLLVCTFSFLGVYLHAQETPPTPQAVVLDSNAEMEKAVTDYLLEKSKLSGTLDIMDEKSNTIRNLRLISIQKESLAGSSMPLVDFRDINSGEIVTVELKLHGGKIESSQVINVTPAESIILDPNKVFTDDEVQDFIKEYINTQAHLSGSFSLFDEGAKRLRNLELISLDSQLRRLGILFICSAEFKDSENKDTLQVDVTVENQKGKLQIQALRIRKVIPAG